MTDRKWLHYIGSFYVRCGPLQPESAKRSVAYGSLMQIWEHKYHKQYVSVVSK